MTHSPNHWGGRGPISRESGTVFNGKGEEGKGASGSFPFSTENPEEVIQLIFKNAEHLSSCLKSCCLSACKGSYAQNKKHVKDKAVATIAFQNMDCSSSKVDWDILDKGAAAHSRHHPGPPGAYQTNM